MKKLAIFASGNGTNAENIHKFFSRGNRVAVETVIYDRNDAGVAARMKPYGVETIFVPGSVWRENPEKILDMLRARGIDMVVLAGFLRMVPDCITEAYDHRILNIHPSLLPAYGGKGMFGHHVHEAVIANGEKRSGVTVHYVTPVCDGGEIVMQQEVEVTPEDTPETLEAKIHPVEYNLYPRAIVAALSRLPENGETADNTDGNKDQAEISCAPAEDHRSQTPPPVPPAKEWADALGMEYDPSRIVPPPYSAGEQPLYNQQAAQAYVRQSPYERPHQPAYGEPQKPYSQTSQPAYGEPLKPAGAENYKTREDMPPMPPTNMIWAVLSTVICCFIPGIIAIIMSAKVSSRYMAGDYEGARRASVATEWWVIASFVLGLLSSTLYMPVSLLFN